MTETQIHPQNQEIITVHEQQRVRFQTQEAAIASLKFHLFMFTLFYQHDFTALV